MRIKKHGTIILSSVLLLLGGALGASVFFSDRIFRQEASEEKRTFFNRTAQMFIKSGLKEAASEVWSGKLVFVGDIMLDRNVEAEMERHGFTYPFEKISRLTENQDIVFANLEGPINKKAWNFAADRMKFSFEAGTIQGIKLAHFNLFSLANNHTYNTGQAGLTETREILQENQIDFVGDPVQCGQSFAFQKDKLIFLAFNKTYSFNCSDESLVQTVGLTRKQHLDDFLIVSLHWGTEYQLASSVLQRDLAHQLIEAGADLIIGHHPHVVQGIEKYRDKLIFYSLGNFIFDQYFSRETQEGLLVKAELYPQKDVYYLVPIVSKLSQPSPMGQEESRVWLEDLARRSDKRLSDQIRSGSIEIIKK